MMRPVYVIAALACCLAFAMALSVRAGAVELTAGELLAALAGRGEPTAVVIVRELRLPRIVLAALVGGGLAVAGAAMQGVFRNPLADPGVIGVSAGGALGAMSGIVAGGAFLPLAGWIALFWLPLWAMAGAIGATTLIYQLAKRAGEVDLVSMLLVGIAFNAFAGAVIGILTFVADDAELRNIAFWALGSMTRASPAVLPVLFLLVLAPSVALLAFAKPLNAYALGERNAFYLGVDIVRTKRRVVVLAAAVVGTTVAFCGIIGFVALVAPHIIRLLLGPDHRHLLPAAGLLGALLLVLADWAARTMVAPAELPIGILTALVGAPFFLLIVNQVNRKAELRS